jgi:RNA polymerase sigma factor (sigma-70 family)
MKKDSYTDQEIIIGIQRQNNTALLFLYQKNFRAVLHYIEQNRGNYKDAEDIFQEAMVFLHNKIIDRNLELTCSIHTYLFSVTKILWLRNLNRNSKIITENLDCDNFISSDEDMMETMMYNERKTIFLKHFYELTGDCRKIIRLFLMGVSISEITATMGYKSEQHTKNRRFRCKKNLIEKIQQNPYFKKMTNGTVRENNQIPRW